jgi:Phage terminase large subunit (GpA)
MSEYTTSSGDKAKSKTRPAPPVANGGPKAARGSFASFLGEDARVPVGSGRYGNYSFAGREALHEIVKVIDQIIAETQPDAELSLAGGAQFGKTILELNFAAYVTGRLFRNFGLYLPNDDLVAGIVDSKFRPDVVDQIDGFAKLTQVGKALNKSGRAVNRKGAFLVTDGQRKAVGMIRGLGKVPTTFSMDVAAMDEVDDIQPRMMKFVAGRLTASDLRFLLKIGTQRIHGRGMNRAWKDGSQGVVTLKCPRCGRIHNPEEEFPGIIRLGGTGRPGSNSKGKTLPRATHLASAAKLTWAGDLRKPGHEETAAVHEPANQYYLGCVDCGAELDRTAPVWLHRQPAQIGQRHWSFRISQLGIGAIDLSQIVGRFQRAAADAEEMVAFRCDVLGLPQSTAQALTPAIIERARTAEPFDLATRAREGCAAYGGLDMGDRCWLYAREVQGSKSQGQSRLLAVERLSAGDVVARAPALFARLGLTALFIDERPLVNEARTLALALNGLQSLAAWPKIPEAKDAYLTLPGGLTWDGKNARWLNLKCAVVRFTKNRLGAGLEQGLVFFEEGGQTKFVPMISCNRFETIDRVVREFLTPAEGVVEVVEGQVRETPAMLLPRQTPGHPPLLDLLEAHLVTGSEREKETDGTLGDYVDGCENHFLLADGYSKLAEILCAPRPAGRFGYTRIDLPDRNDLKRTKGIIA